MINETELNQNKTHRERSTSYPAVSLEQSIILASQLKDALGKGPYSREAASKAMGHQKETGASAAKIAALVHFGLLNRVGNTYSQSSLATRILLPTSEQDKQFAIKEAVRTPKLYKLLINAYEGSSLPSLLKNILVNNYGILEKYSANVAEIFKKSLEFAGLLKNGVIVNEEELMEIKDEDHNPFSLVEQQDVLPMDLNTPSIKDNVSTDFVQSATLNLTYGKAQIFLPSRVTKKDFERIKKQIEVMAVIEDNL